MKLNVIGKKFFLKKAMECKTEKTSNPMEKWAQDLNVRFSKGRQVVSAQHHKMQIKITIIPHFIPTRIAII